VGVGGVEVDFDSPTMPSMMLRTPASPRITREAASRSLLLELVVTGDDTDSSLGQVSKTLAAPVVRPGYVP
jgi:hypothetical protein